jgi:hypothetical protein
MIIQIIAASAKTILTAIAIVFFVFFIFLSLLFDFWFSPPFENAVRRPQLHELIVENPSPVLKDTKRANARIY